MRKQSIAAQIIVPAHGIASFAIILGMAVLVGVQAPSSASAAFFYEGLGPYAMEHCVRQEPRERNHDPRVEDPEVTPHIIMPRTPEIGPGEWIDRRPACPPGTRPRGNELQQK